MRVVLDTNVLMAALFEDDEWAQQIIIMQHHGRIEFVACPQIITEWVYIFGMQLKDIYASERISHDLVERIIDRFCRIERETEKIFVRDKTAVSKDPDDDIFIQCAVDGNADYIVSKNSEDLNVHSEKIANKKGTKIKILSPYRAYWEIHSILNGKRVKWNK